MEQRAKESPEHMVTSTEIDRVIWRADLTKVLDVSSETIRRYIKDAKLPPPDIDLSLRTRGWRISTLRAAGINIPA